MKLVHKDMGHILTFDDGFVNELIIENKKAFFRTVNGMALQAEGEPGDFVLSVENVSVEFCKHADLSLQFTPFRINRKPLLTKLYSALEKQALVAEHYEKTVELLSALERYVFCLSEDFPFELNCQKLSVGSILRALAPEIEENDKNTLEKIFSYMELVREFDRDKLFITVNLRSYFSDDEMETFLESVSIHDFKMLLIENTEYPKLKHTKRYVIDADLCEF